MTDQKTPRSLPLSEAITISAQAIGEVMVGRSLTEVLDQLDAHERPIVQSLTFDALRKWVRSHEFIKQFIPKTPPVEVEHLLSVAIALFLQRGSESKGYAAHTIVDQAVKACSEYEPTMYAKGLVNAVLRKVSLAVQAENEKPYPPDPIPMFFPPWWRASLKRNHSKSWQAMLIQQAQRAPLILRVNLKQHTRQEYQELLHQAGIVSEPIDSVAGISLNSALVLREPVPVSDLPGFYSGAVSVQDAGAQIAAVLLDPKPGERVLDACAAPGGKTAHLLELAQCEMIALELDGQRLGKIGGNLDRLRLQSDNVQVVRGDASKAVWWDGKLFDKILLDAPCSASGIVARHPDIPFLRREADIKALQLRQRAILEQAWKMLKMGGTLLYVTCSVFPEEGEEQAVWFANEYSDALRLSAPGQILPAELNDGFFYALFKKKGP
ncbi:MULTISPECIES: 16S rRNA (cytosine(967)-C(5))-methyltransferase RsmB [unclassified Polynucleobacter]|uniref:16S rRNA (cytosine(967)-C(5))-methyltransferase RsmB n=1 Tax=unclassified Polynucleobacter TaxID=2640945 RepID=UPI0008BFCB53|nr:MULTISPECIES: 16S rRNA (cytosine(967)-C(5))-methyltransferase RsmB [unclassified Polynucleobacter]OHC09194.1 MAG: 16S rRNA (cytosine(967)-C(5))-methyltransferase [Polynucleobacter sp. GWA2_45_21]HBK43209.1 16S rRNA (cytosine(967)-C(5))-methyltransferase RsmB [Polynucleobacter sp.]